MDLKVERGPRIQPTQEQVTGWEAISAPYSASERVAAGVFVTDLGGEPAKLQRLLEAQRLAAPNQTPLEQHAEDAAQTVVATERSIHAATHTRGALTAASRVLLQGEAVEDIVGGGAHNSSTAAKVVAGLGLAGGVVQGAQGVQQLANGNLGEGAVNVTAGGLTTAAGAVELAAPVAVARRFVPALAGAAGVIEGVGDVLQGVQDHTTEKVVVGSVKAAGGAMLAAAPWIGGSVVGAPAAAVVGVTGGALLAGAEIYEAVRHFSSK